MNQLRKEMKPQSFFYRCIYLCLSVIASMTIASAQNGENPSSYVIPGWYGIPNYSEKTIQGFNDPVTCADFSNGPFEIYINYYSKTPETKTILVSLYVPAFTKGKSYPVQDNVIRL